MSSNKGPRECTRKFDFYRLPKILVLQLKRFTYGTYSKCKLNYSVQVPQDLDLSPLVTLSQHHSTRNANYELVGVVNHSGGIDFGHYTAECKNPGNGQWYNFNDSTVSPTSMGKVINTSNAYVLFYSRK